jgi:hypothetical protein
MYIGPNPADWNGITRLVKTGDSEQAWSKPYGIGDRVAIKKFSDVQLPDQTPIWNDTPTAHAAPRK